MNNTRFATVIHILTLLADSEEERLSSEWIAGSININPVIVRRELSILSEAGLVLSRKGKDGGSTLNKKSRDIRLSEIYLIVKNSEVLGKMNLKTNPKCPIGRSINQKLENLFSEIDLLLLRELQHKTLEDFVQQFH